jgi:hypothetical protein
MPRKEEEQGFYVDNFIVTFTLTPKRGRENDMRMPLTNVERYSEVNVWSVDRVGEDPFKKRVTGTIRMHTRMRMSRSSKGKKGFITQIQFKESLKKALSGIYRVSGIMIKRER